MKPAIQVEGVSKQYHIGVAQASYATLRDSIAGLARSAVGRRSKRATRASSTFWALRDINLEIGRGEVIGVIGRNGAGKSTLLKVLSRITEPTTGCVKLYGRIGSLLEVGTGFHPELTGRENIFLNGAILGMARAEIERKFDAIVAFSEVEQFIDTPVKFYSSGMYVRLAFGVAAHLEPEILLVDEVLAVGDAAFQKKCLGKMGDVAKEGRTILFVSHNMGAIARLCNRSMWLDGGRVAMDGPTNAVINAYQSRYLQACPEWNRANEPTMRGDLVFRKISVVNRLERLTGIFDGDEPITVRLTYEVGRTLAGCQIGVRIYNSDGIVVFTTSDADESGVSAHSKEAGSYAASFSIPASFLAPGSYFVTAGAHLPNRSVYDIVEQAVVFEVSPSGSLASLDGRLGLVSPLLHWETLGEARLQP